MLKPWSILQGFREELGLKSTWFLSFTSYSYWCLAGNEGMIHWLTINNHPIPPFPSIPYQAPVSIECFHPSHGESSSPWLLTYKIRCVDTSHIFPCHKFTYIYIKRESITILPININSHLSAGVNWTNQATLRCRSWSKRLAWPWPRIPSLWFIW